ncbi:hypothetical protein QL093DRAFT_2530225 [Fusarium oxysporum]|nr:hypothetical protein QL093DRAFT_2530225 [Fusarium oxysporum]
MCTIYTYIYAYHEGRSEQWSRRNFCADSNHGEVCARPVYIAKYVPAPYDASSYPYVTQRCNPTSQHRPAPPSTPFVSHGSGDKSDSGYTNNSSVSNQTVLDHRRRGHPSSSRSQGRIIQTHARAIVDERTCRLEQGRVQFEGMDNRRHSMNHMCNSNSTSGSRHSKNEEYRRGEAERQQEAMLRVRTRIAEANAEIASRPVTPRRRAEVMNTYSKEYDAEEYTPMTFEQAAQQQRLRERMQGRSGWPGEAGTYRHD